MGVNKVLVGDEVKLDLTADTVSEDNLLAGTTAHNAAGEPIEGTVVTVPVDSELSETSENAIQNMAVAKAVNVLKSDLVDCKGKIGYNENIAFNYVRYASFYSGDTQTSNNNHNGSVKETLNYENVIIDATNTNLEICVVGYSENNESYFEVKWGSKANFTPKENYKYQIVAKSGSKTAPEFYSEMSEIVTIGTKKGTIETEIEEINNSLITLSNHVIVEVSQSDNLVNIIESIADSSKSKQYDVYVSGEHDIIQELGGQTYVSSITQEMSGLLGLILPDYVNLYGVGNDAKLTGYIPKTYNNVVVATWKVSTLQINATNHIENLTITAKNLRYAIHDESNGVVKNGVKHLKDLTLIHYGNSEVNGAWVSTNAYGMGASSGSKLYSKNCDFISYEQIGFACHDNTNFENGALLEFDNCRFSSINGEVSFNLTSYGSGTKENVCYLNNCVIDKNYTNGLLGGADTSRWKLKGCNTFKRANIDDVIIES